MMSLVMGFQEIFAVQKNNCARFIVCDRRETRHVDASAAAKPADVVLFPEGVFIGVSWLG
jgi:hypothetical protein